MSPPDADAVATGELVVGFLRTLAAALGAEGATLWRLDREGDTWCVEREVNAGVGPDAVGRGGPTPAGGEAVGGRAGSIGGGTGAGGAGSIGGRGGSVDARGHPFTWAAREGLLLQVESDTLMPRSPGGGWSLVGPLRDGSGVLCVSFRASPGPTARPAVGYAAAHLGRLLAPFSHGSRAAEGPRIDGTTASR